MPYDLYDYFIKQRNSKYSDAVDIVREKIWMEDYNTSLSKKWIKTEDEILIELYILLRYT